MKEKLVVIVGPTAVGKTELSVKLSQRYGGEVISGDSMQVYKGMDIGTAKVTPQEQSGVPHHLIDILEPLDSFSVAEFHDQVIPLISRINEDGHIPFLVGGTGLYVNAITKGYQLNEMPVDQSYRLKLEQLATEYGANKLHNMLLEIDEEAALNIHPNNVRRVIRALEVSKLTGIPFSKHQQEEENDDDPLYDLVYIGLTMERKYLYERINLRVERMIENGLLDEARSLYDQGIRNCQSVQAIGYKELYLYFEGTSTINEAIDQIKQNSRRYAKRQLTWFRNKSNATWFDMTAGITDKVFSDICTLIEGKYDSLSK